MKRFLTTLFSLILLLMVCCFALPTEVHAADSGTCGTNLTWTLDDAGTFTISGTGAMDDWELLNDDERPWYSLRSSIKAVVINDGVTTIGKSAFYDCKQLTEVSLAKSVTKICAWAFYNCSTIETVSVPANVSTIHYTAFVDCASLKSFVVSSGNRYYSSPDGALCEKSTGTLISWPGGRSEAVIPDEISIIGGQAFSGPSVTSVVIPKSVKTVRAYAFSYCDNLQRITIKGNASLANGFIDYCDKLSAFIVEDSTAYSSVDGVLYNKNMTTLIKCPPAKTVISIPGTIVKIEEAAFEQCRYLYEILLPNALKTIESSAFSGCSNLQRIALPENISEIKNFVFSNCGSLTSIVIPSGVKSIGHWSFYGCKSLKHILYGGSSSMWSQISKDAPEIPAGAVFTYNFQEGTSYHVYDDDADTHCNVCNQFRLIGCVGETLGIEITTNADYDYTLVGANANLVSAVFTGQTSIIIGSVGRYCKGYDLRFSRAGNYELRFVQETTGSTITFYAEISDHTYDHACDTSCNSCDATRQTQHIFNTDGICTICGALEHIPGDMNGDEEINDADAMYLLRYTLFGENRYPLNQSADVNGDGHVNDADAMYLLRYTLFPERYPLK